RWPEPLFQLLESGILWRPITLLARDAVAHGAWFALILVLLAGPGWCGHSRAPLRGRATDDLADRNQPSSGGASLRSVSRSCQVQRGWQVSQVYLRILTFYCYADIVMTTSAVAVALYRVAPNLLRSRGGHAASAGCTGSQHTHG